MKAVKLFSIILHTYFLLILIGIDLFCSGRPRAIRVFYFLHAYTKKEKQEHALIEVLGKLCTISIEQFSVFVELSRTSFRPIKNNF